MELTTLSRLVGLVCPEGYEISLAGGGGRELTIVKEVYNAVAMTILTVLSGRFYPGVYRLV